MVNSASWCRVVLYMEDMRDQDGAGEGEEGEEVCGTCAARTVRSVRGRREVEAAEHRYQAGRLYSTRV